MGRSTLRLSNVGLIILAITVVGAFLRLVTLDAHGFWIDEVESLDISSLGVPTFITDRFGYAANQTPLHYGIVWLTSLLADPSTTTIIGRLPSALAGALTIPLVYALGKELFGEAQGLIAALLLALSAVHLNYSQDLRPYSMLVFLTTLSVYALIRADRTNSRGWWAGFVAAGMVNALNSYVALSFATPIILPCLAWVLWHKWRNRVEERPALLSAVFATVILIIGLALSVIDLLNAPHVSPDLGRYSLAAGLSSIPELLTFFTQFGMDAGFERPLELVVLVVSLIGLLMAVAHQIRSGRRYQGAVICLLFVVVPPLLLSLFATTGTIFQRYVLFVMPFYFLQISHGIVSLYGLLPPREHRSVLLVWRGISVAVASVVVAAFLLGTYAYISPDLHSRVAFRPDFRAVATYLSPKVSPLDTVIFVDDTGHGYTITNFYWKNNPPTAIYDSRDPLLFTRQSRGDIYWVTSFDNESALSKIAQPDMGWVEVATFERVRVLHETGSKSILDSMSRLVDKLSAIMPNFQPIITLQGCLLQARGQLQEAAAAYKRAGTYFPIGDDYLHAAIGYDNLGNSKYAWREALLSKYLQPFLPEVHIWLANKLQSENYPDQSRAEMDLARLLATAR